MQLLKKARSLPSFSNFQIFPQLLSLLEEQHILTPTPVQEQVIPSLLNKKSLLFSAQNGTGKTLAYLIPLVCNLKADEIQQRKILTQSQNPRAIIVLPIRELVLQVESAAKILCSAIPLKIEQMTGGVSIKQEKQIALKGMDVLITTYDKLLDQKQCRNIMFQNMKYAVFDEVDTSVDMQKSQIILSMYKRYANTAQFILSTATMPKTVERFYKQMNSIAPIEIIKEKGTQINLSNIQHKFIKLSEFDKRNETVRAIKECQKYTIPNNTTIIIFCNSVASARSLDYFLTSLHYNITSIHGQLPPNLRHINYQKFKHSSANILIATDLASRGLDFPHTSHIINFDFPKTTSDYMHRAGRAGRAGRQGFVYSLYRNSDESLISVLTKSFHTRKEVPMLNSSFTERKK